MMKHNAENSQTTMQQGILAFRQKQFDRAYETLRVIAHPIALNVAGVCAQNLGQFVDADKCFKRANKLAPNDANVLNNWGHLKLKQNEYEDARHQFSQALSINPDMTAAKLGLAKVHAAEGAWSEAKRGWAQVLQRTPDSRVAKYGLATTLLELGETEAAIRNFHALQSEKRSPEVSFMLGRAYLELSAFDQAETELLYAHAQNPSELSLRTLASLYWMQDRTDQFFDILTDVPRPLVRVKIKILLEAALFDHAREAWRTHSHDLSTNSDGQVLLSIIEQNTGTADAALHAAKAAITLDQNNDAAWEAKIISDLKLGNPKHVAEAVQPLRRKSPLAQNWIAYEADATRLLGVRETSDLLDTDRWVQAHPIGIPRGFESREAFNQAFAEYLTSKHELKRRPLDQSLRGGTQTTRSLLHDDHPIVRAYVEALDEPIRKYLSSIGTDRTHPTTARNTGKYRFSGMWSVRLCDQGYHESHIHPEGWISSAYYVKVPNPVAGSRAGWIFFGRPPFVTTPELEPLKWIQPEAGMLVLFPSYMWHGTVATDGPVERVTAPFDLLPA